MSFTADHALATLNTAIMTRLNRRRDVDWLLMRRGFATRSATSSSRATTGRSQCGRNTRRYGMVNCSPTAAATATLAGHRDSPSVTARQAGKAAFGWRTVCSPCRAKRRSTSVQPRFHAIGVGRPVIPVSTGRLVIHATHVAPNATECAAIWVGSARLGRDLCTSARQPT